MKQLLLFAVTFCLFSFANAQMPANVGLGFTPNLGQFADQEGKPADNVLFKACGTGPGIFVTTSGLTYVFERSNAVSEQQRENGEVGSVDWSAIHMTLVGADIRQENVVMENELPGLNNYYYPHCPDGITGVKSYHKITIKNIYPGIDWMLFADDVNGVVHDFMIHGNGKHSDIRMRYDGLSAPITINSKRQLALVSPLGTIYEGGLAVKRCSDGKLLTSYFNVSGNEVSYLIVRGARSQGAILIDPPLQWSMPQTSSGFDYGSGVAATKDGSGDVLGCGYTDGSDYPVMNATQGTLSAQEDAVVYRLDANGNRLWSTYFGGTDIDNAKGIATDVAGNAYVVGHTNSSDLPVMNSLQPFYGGGVYDAFISKYNNAGVLQWASWRGGTGTDFGTAITADDNGNCYVVGYTNTTVNFPLLNAIQPTKAGGAGVYDAFVMSFSSAQVMNWSTYYGGTDEDKFRAVALDPQSANIVIAGNSMSGNFPTAGTPFQLLNAQAWFTSDAVIMKMNINQSVVFASYCGGYEDDFATGITCDAAGNIYATGYTISSDFPKVVQPTNAYSDTTLNAIGVQDAFVVKCDPTGSTLFWSTYYGGTASDYGFAIGYKQNYGVYVCGNTASTDFPVHQPADVNHFQPSHGDGGNYNDAWIAWFDINDSVRWSTYLGGPNSEEAYGLSVGMQGEIYITGVDSNDIGIAKFNPGLPMSTQPVCCFGTSEIYLYPNPATDFLDLRFNSYDGAITVEITDVSGRLVRREERSVANGEITMHLDVSELATGLYNLKLNTPAGESVQQFIRE